MRPSYRILLLALAVSASLPASSEGPVDARADGEDEAVTPSHLDSFVREAIDEGLLKPSTPGEPRQLVKPEAPAEVPQPQAVPSPKPAKLPASFNCPSANPYDFTAYQNLQTYDDLLALRQTTGQGEDLQSKLDLARAYIALGLNEEARLQLGGLASTEAEALRHLAAFLEGRDVHEVDYFGQLSVCAGTPDLWAIMADLDTAPENASERLDAGLESFRPLPLQMRIELAARAVPALYAMDEAQLAARYMAGFTREEIARSSRLSFNRTLLDMDAGAAETVAAMRGYVRQPEFQEAAVESLLAHGYEVDRRFQSDVATRVVEEVKRSPVASDVSGQLDTVLTELNGITDYGMTLQLAEVPATQSPEARERLASHYISLVDSDLRSGALMDNLRGMDALIRGVGLVEDHEASERILGQATALAVDLGFQHLAEVFASRTDNPEELAEARAALAYRTLDHGGLKKLLASNPNNPGVIRLGALSALRAGDQTLLNSLLPKLDASADTVIALVEMDAASGRWMLPDRIYRAAAKLEAGDYEARFERVQALRADTGAQASPQTYDMVEIGEALARSRQVIAPQSKEMR